MNWYIVKIVYQIICGEGHHTPQFDEQLRALRADDPREALSKALSLGYSEQDSFMNDNMKLVQWKFVNVAELYRLSEMTDGGEVYSRIHECDDAFKYIQLVNKKADRLKNQLEELLPELYQ